ncbi:MAG: ParB/RepB/Spo0J family partition protein [Clostridia bacterium]|nr:ParB/RepB/Spo0J family partition protein [Clostridia bacterium]
MLFKGRTNSTLVYLAIDKISKNDAQPRQNFDEDALRSLSESIKQNGIIQPLCVRKNNEGGYTLISGERRLKAASMAGLKKIPCVLTDADERSSALLAIVENIQREDLNCFEEADSIFRLISEWGIPREQVAERLGMAGSTLSNKLRLLKLTPWERERISAARLSERHARTLLRIEDIEKRDNALLTIIAKGLNVAESEKMVSEMLSEKKDAPSKKRMVVGDIRLFANTISNAVDTMRRSGVNATAEKNETERFIEYKILIPKIVSFEENDIPVMVEI